MRSTHERVLPGGAGLRQTGRMAVSRADRRKSRVARVSAVFGTATPSALDLLELVELAWHDCYGEITPSEDVIDDLLLLSQGRLDGLVGAARLAIADWRDVKIAADQLRGQSRSQA